MSAKKTNKLALALALALAGCSTPESTVPLPPAPSLAVSRRSAAFALSSTNTPKYTAPTKMDYVTSGIGLSGAGTNIVVSWPTNMADYVVIYSTNVSVPRALWTMPRQDRATNGNRIEVVVTNGYPQCFFTLVKRETNCVLLTWNYDFIRSPNAAGFVLYRGPASRFYTNRVDVGMCLWHSMPAPFATNYYTVTAHDGFGLESEPSNEAVYVRQNP